MRFLVITFVLVLLLGGASFVSVMTMPSQVAKSPEVVRNPASLPEMQTHSQPAPLSLSKLEDLAWDCRNANQGVEIFATHVRLKGKTVCKGQEIKEFRIKNLSNGFTATVFANEKGFLTDFIDLNPGANDVQIEYADKVGKTTVASLTILRK